MEAVQLVVWAVNNEEYAVEIENVQEIIRVPEITRMPFSPYYMPGVINLRGRIIPVIDMAGKLLKPKLMLSDLSRIIIVCQAGVTAGLLVDDVSEILKLDISCIESRDILSSSESNRYIKGIGKLGGKVVPILDLEKIFVIQDKLEL